MNLPIAAAFLGGLLSFFSPCVLPLVPVYLSTLLGGRERAPMIKITVSIFFGLGFSFVFVLLGALATAVGHFLIEYKQVLYTASGVVVIILGLHMLGVVHINALFKEKRLSFPKYTGRYAGAFFIGAAFAMGWTPCVGPILAGILTLALQSEGVGRGMFLLAVYSLGLFLPFLAAALFYAPLFAKLSKYPKLPLYAERGAGVVLILMGLLLSAGSLTRISSLLSAL